MNAFFDGYVSAALWAETGAHAGYGIEAFAPEALDTLRRDCVEFLERHGAAVSVYCDKTGRSLEGAGHDFWLTRNGHGAGFWDRGAGDVGEYLTSISTALGSREVFVGDDGKIYCA